jgi:hypothetical protein
MFDLHRDDSSSVADWVEIELALDDEIDRISKATVSTAMEQGIGAAPSEAFLSDVWRILERRQNLYRLAPFRVEGNLVMREEEVPPPETYIACLLFSLYGVRRGRSDPKILERIAAICIADYIQGESYVFGWPVLHDVPVPISNRIQEVAQLMRERFIEAPREKYKDRGVDVITWKPFRTEAGGMHRSNQIAILSQCAAGQDWRQKYGDVPLKAWEQYIHWANNPIKGYVVPGIVDSDDDWHDMSTQCGLLFDRARIYNHSPNPLPDPELAASITAWIDAEKQEALS